MPRSPRARSRSPRPERSSRPRTGAERARQLVPSELELEAARRPDLTRLSRTWSAAYAGTVSAALAGLGCDDPSRDAWIVVPTLEGMTLDALAAGHDDRDEQERAVTLLEALSGR
ncbi:MAG: hypothetical protein ACRC50_01300 [Gaiella sp.]